MRCLDRRLFAPDSAELVECLGEGASLLAALPLQKLLQVVGIHDRGHQPVPLVDPLGLLGRLADDLGEPLLRLSDLPVHRELLDLSTMPSLLVQVNLEGLVLMICILTQVPLLPAPYERLRNPSTGQ
jgi:hypothetical protein